MNIVCISGKAGSGKDCATDFLRGCLEERGERVLITHNADLLKYICKTFFGWNGEKDEAGRSLLQYIGTDMIRAAEPNFFTRFIADIIRIFPEEFDWVLIPDCRFPNEVEYIAENVSDTNLWHIHIEREYCNRAMTDEQLQHISETAMDSYPADYIIENNGSLDDLQGSIQAILDDIDGKPIYEQITFDELIGG